MNRCGYHQRQQERNVLVGYGGDMRWGGSLISVSGNGVVCPKPRRFGLLNPSLNDQIKTLHKVEVCDSKAGTELLDILLEKGAETSNTPVASSPPPFFCGSPPSRASNPVIQDAEFGNNNLSPPGPRREASPSSSVHKNGGYVRVKFAHKPAPVRIEGFNCRGISAVA